MQHLPEVAIAMAALAILLVVAGRKGLRIWLGLREGNRDRAAAFLGTLVGLAGGLGSKGTDATRSIDPAVSDSDGDFVSSTNWASGQQYRRHH